MILFDNVYEVLDLTHLDAGVSLRVMAFDRRGVSATLINRDLIRRATMFDRFARKP